MTGEVEKLGHVTGRSIWMTRVWKTNVWLAELIKEWMAKSLDGGKTLGGSVLQESGDQVNCLMGGLAEDLTGRRTNQHTQVEKENRSRERRDGTLLNG